MKKVEGEGLEIMVLIFIKEEKEKKGRSVSKIPGCWCELQERRWNLWMLAKGGTGERRYKATGALGGDAVEVKGVV